MFLIKIKHSISQPIESKKNSIILSNQKMKILYFGFLPHDNLSEHFDTIQFRRPVNVHTIKVIPHHQGKQTPHPSLRPLRLFTTPPSIKLEFFSNNLLEDLDTYQPMCSPFFYEFLENIYCDVNPNVRKI
jgi:hypothetical protein